MKLRVPWDGADPKPGEWLTAPDSTHAFHILMVGRRRSGHEVRLALDVARHPATAVPRLATVHPWSRTTVVREDGPPAVRQRAGTGPTAVMRSKWADPTSVSPKRMTRANTVGGWRAFCPLRRIADMGGGQITEAHIIAADRLRETADLAAIGYSASRDLSDPYASVAAGPRGGPPEAAMKQVWASAEVRQVAKVFTEAQVAMLAKIVLQNMTIQAWTAERSAAAGRNVDPKIEMGKLVALLDILADQYAREDAPAARIARR